MICRAARDRSIIVACDDCGRTFRPRPPAVDVTRSIAELDDLVEELRASAQRRGWSHEDRRDLCPHHKPQKYERPTLTPLGTLTPRELLRLGSGRRGPKGLPARFAR